MGYFEELDGEWRKYKEWASLLKERGGRHEKLVKKMVSEIKGSAEDIKRELGRPALTRNSPDSLLEIRKLRPSGPRRLTDKIDFSTLEEKIKGAWIGRCAGCILGIPVEGLKKEDIRNICRNEGIEYPVCDYWEREPKSSISPEFLHYRKTPRKNFFKKNLKYVGADDDLAYTLLGMLILEEYGTGFTTADVAKMWLKHLIIACTAEEIALENLKKGIPPQKAGITGNPFQDWIGADIRSDPWGYAAAGWPEKAAEFAYRDAYLSHRAEGLYGAMFFSAVIAASFVSRDPVEAVRIGLTEIPGNCRLSKTVGQTLEWCDKDRDWETTVDRILTHFNGMSVAHTINNAALTVAGLFYGRNDFGKTICLTVMSGLDTDCTGATAGSISGAVLGIHKIPARWKKPLGNRVEAYLKGKQSFRSDDIARRFLKIARRLIQNEIA